MKWTIITIYVLSILHIHFRGRVRLPFFRQIFDHSSFVSPLNTFMHLFSGVPATPYLPTSRFRIVIGPVDGVAETFERFRALRSRGRLDLSDLE